MLQKQICSRFNLIFGQYSSFLTRESSNSFNMKNNLLAELALCSNNNWSRLVLLLLLHKIDILTDIYGYKKRVILICSSTQIFQFLLLMGELDSSPFCSTYLRNPTERGILMVLCFQSSQTHHYC